MQKASETVPGAMLTVFCDHQTKLRTAMVAAREYCRQRLDIDEPVCHVANYLCTDIKVVAGHEEVSLLEVHLLHLFYFCIYK